MEIKTTIKLNQPKELPATGLFTVLRSIYLGEEKRFNQETEGRQLSSPDPAMRPLSEQRAQSRSGTSSSNLHTGPPHPVVFQEQQNGSSRSSARSSSEPEATLLNMLQPVPSQLLHVDYRGQKLTITLDSGATVSFWSPTLVRRLGLTLHPNSQLALLADSRFRVRSMGKVDFLVVEQSTGEALLQVRALIMDNLAVDCYGGQTFHLDNAVSGDVSGGRIILHGGRWEVRPKHGAASQPKPPPAESVKEMPGQEGAGMPAVAAISSSGETVLMKTPQIPTT